MSNAPNTLPDTVRQVIEAGRSAPSADNSQPWRFRWDGQYLSLEYDDTRQSTSVFDKSAPAVLLALGAAIENMFAAVSAIGAKVEWSFPAFADDSTSIYCRARFETLGNLTDEAKGLALFGRHTNRFPYQKRAIDVSAGEISGWQEGAARIQMFTDARQLKALARLVKDASSLRFQIKEVHEWFAQTLRFSHAEVQSGDGLDVDTLYLPPGGRSLLKLTSSWGVMRRLNRLGVHKVFAAIEAAPIAQAPAILAITAPAGKAPIIEAGRLLQRAWCELNKRGIAVHPFYVLPDQLTRVVNGTLPASLAKPGDTLAAGADSFFETRGHHLQMLLRIGYPLKTPVRSKRLELSDLLIDENRL